MSESASVALLALAVLFLIILAMGWLLWMETRPPRAPRTPAGAVPELGEDDPMPDWEFHFPDGSALFFGPDYRWRVMEPGERWEP